MHKLCITILATAALLLPWNRANAQKDSLKNQINLKLEVMAHGEICAGGLPRAAKSQEDHSSFLFGRTRITAEYLRKGLQVHATLQNLAVWGMKGSQALNLYEGWAKISSRQGLFAQVGRVVLSYDDERIIGANDMATAALSHDVVRLGYEGHGHKFHAILAYNQNSENVYSGTFYSGGAQAYKTMQTFWYHYDFSKIPLGASLLFMNMGLQAGSMDPTINVDPKVVFQQMMGTYINLHPKNFTLEASAYLQRGQTVVGDIKPYPIQAWMASVKANYTPTEKWGFVLGYDHLSGDDFVPVDYGGNPLGLPDHKIFKGFTPLYGSRTQFYGIMDYFYESAYSSGFTPGLQNAFVGVTSSPVKPLSCGLTYHYLAVATHLDKLSPTLGHSLELNVSYTFTKDISLSIGYTFMSGTETMACLKREGASKQAHWGWFTLLITPNLFTARW